MPRLSPLALLAGLACLGCASYGYNYLHPDGPRCVDPGPASAPSLAGDDVFTLVSFNVAFGKSPEQALATLRRAGLDTADVLLLQEVDLPATRTLASGLGAGYVYYPANRHPKTRRQFGVAVVSRWPIRDDRKLLLARFETSDDARKVALAATVWVRGVAVGFVDVHLQSGLSPVWLGDQLQLFALCLLTERCPQAGAPLLAERERVVMAGDFNTRGTEHVHVAERVLGWSGFRRVSRLGKTMKWMPDEMGRIDHVFVRGALEAEDAGIVAGFFKLGSDHRPIWARLRLTQVPAGRWQGFDPEAGRPAVEAGPECPEAGPWRGERQ